MKSQPTRQELPSGVALFAKRRNARAHLWSYSGNPGIAAQHIGCGVSFFGSHTTVKGEGISSVAHEWWYPGHVMQIHDLIMQVRMSVGDVLEDKLWIEDS